MKLTCHIIMDRIKANNREKNPRKKTADFSGFGFEISKKIGFGFSRFTKIRFRLAEIYRLTGVSISVNRSFPNHCLTKL